MKLPRLRMARSNPCRRLQLSKSGRERKASLWIRSTSNLLSICSRASYLIMSAVRCVFDRKQPSPASQNSNESYTAREVTEDFETYINTTAQRTADGPVGVFRFTTCPGKCRHGILLSQSCNWCVRVPI